MVSLALVGMHACGGLFDRENRGRVTRKVGGKGFSQFWRCCVLSIYGMLVLCYRLATHQHFR